MFKRMTYIIRTISLFQINLYEENVVQINSFLFMHAKLV